MGLFKMTISTQFVTLQVLATLYSTVEALNTATNNKAASQYVNCDCQCSSLTFQDKFGRTQGNCKRADNTGATWCYVDSRSSCLDLDHTEAAEALEAAATIRPAASRTAATVRTATLAAASTDLRREVSVRARAGALPTVVLGRIVMLGTILAVLLLAAVDST